MGAGCPEAAAAHRTPELGGIQTAARVAPADREPPQGTSAGVRRLAA